jgi:DNA-binding LytR/AlgR family response regulator
MKIALQCSQSSEDLLLELLSTRSITVDPASSVCVVEAGLDIPQDKIVIVFHMAQLARLIELFDTIANDGGNSMNSVIGRNVHESYEIIPLDQIHYFEGRGNFVICATVDQEYRIKEKLYELESKLPVNSFIRVAKSYIVNIDNVKEIIPWFGRRLVLKFVHSKREVEVSKNYVKNVKEFLGI